MGTIQYLSIFVFSLTALLGTVVLAHGPKEKINKIFAALVFSFALWIFINIMIDISIDEKDILFWGHLAIAPPLLMPYLLARFSFLFPRENKATKKIELIFINLLGIAGLIGLLLIPSKFNIANMDIADHSTRFEAGPLYTLLFLLMLLSLIISVYLVFKKWKILEKKEKNQIWLIIAGIFLTLIISIITQLVLVIFFDLQVLVSVGPLSTIFITLFTAYAIIRYVSFFINMLATEFFILIILASLSFGIMLSRNNIEMATITAIFISVLIMSFFLIRSILLENERKKQMQELTERLESINKELKKLDQLKNDFIHLVIHEINTPIASILGYLSLVLDEKMVKIDKKAEEYLQKVYASSKRLANVVADFLDIIKIEGGKLKMEFTKINLESFLKEIVLEYKQKAREKNNEIIIQNLNLENIEINIDSDKLKEAIINLVDNAIKFTKNGKIEIVMDKYESRTVIIVKDNGEGIAEEKIGKVFDKFYQTDPSDASRYGTGLGLYITKSIVEMHGGKIMVESLVSKGTKFTIFLPL